MVVVSLVLEVGVRNIPSRENDCKPLFVVLKSLRLYSAVPLVMSDSSDMACTICDKVALSMLKVCKWRGVSETCCT